VVVQNTDSQKIKKSGDNMNILILGDSLALPRPHRIKEYDPINEKELAVHFKETYGFLLEKQLRADYPSADFSVTNRAQRFSTIKNIAQQFWDHLFYFEPDVIILQVGIVDCWFRQDLNGNQLVNASEFDLYYREILKLLEKRPETKMIVIGICPTSMKMEQKFPGLLEQISLYNQILKSGENFHQVFFVDMETHVLPHAPNQFLLPDDHHLNKQGNQLVSTLLLPKIKAFYENVNGCLHYEVDIMTSYRHFLESYELFPYYGDNLYNLIYLSFQMEDWGTTAELIKFVRLNHIQHPNLFKLIESIKEHMNK
jgi:lysophospholipase L1-like esterase